MNAMRSDAGAVDEVSSQASIGDGAAVNDEDSGYVAVGHLTSPGSFSDVAMK